ncbi:unnamed protein product [Sympodiomycopsis kandeliae]
MEEEEPPQLLIIGAAVSRKDVGYLPIPPVALVLSRCLPDALRAVTPDEVLRCDSTRQVAELWSSYKQGTAEGVGEPSSLGVSLEDPFPVRIGDCLLPPSSGTLRWRSTGISA